MGVLEKKQGQGEKMKEEKMKTEKTVLSAAKIAAIVANVTTNYARRYAERHLPGGSWHIAPTLEEEIAQQIANHESTARRKLARRAARQKSALAAARLRETCPACTAKRAAQLAHNDADLAMLEDKYPLSVISHEEYACPICGEVYFIADID